MQQLSQLVEIATVSGIGGLLLGVAKTIIHDNHGSVFRFIRTAVASVVVAVISAFALVDSGLSWTRQAAIIGILAYVADDVLSGLLVLAKLFANNPLTFVKDLVKSIKGGGKP